MTTLVILFIVSFTALMVMVGRKLALVKSGVVAEQEHSHVFVPDFQRIKYLTRINSKRYGYLTLVSTLRLYVKSINMAKNQYRALMQKIKNMRKVEGGAGAAEEKEASKFLKMISDYKHKIRIIKHKIHEEEKS